MRIICVLLLGFCVVSCQAWWGWSDNTNDTKTTPELATESPSPTSPHAHHHHSSHSHHHKSASSSHNHHSSSSTSHHHGHGPMKTPQKPAPETIVTKDRGSSQPLSKHGSHASSHNQKSHNSDKSSSHKHNMHHHRHASNNKPSVNVKTPVASGKMAEENSARLSIIEAAEEDFEESEEKPKKNTISKLEKESGENSSEELEEISGEQDSENSEEKSGESSSEELGKDRSEESEEDSSEESGQNSSEESKEKAMEKSSEESSSEESKEESREESLEASESDSEEDSSEESDENFNEGITLRHHYHRGSAPHHHPYHGFSHHRHHHKHHFREGKFYDDDYKGYHHHSPWHRSEFSYTKRSAEKKLSSCPMLYKRIGDRCIAIFSIAKVSWWDAADFCESIFGDLLSFADFQQYFEFINYLQIPDATSDLWIGGKTEGRTWKWIDGTPMPLGSPYWAIKSNSVPHWSKDAEKYYQAPSPMASFGLGVYSSRCASMSPKYFYYMSDEDCESQRSPVCVLKDDTEVVVLKDWVKSSEIPIHTGHRRPVITPGTPKPETSERGSGETDDSSEETDSDEFSEGSGGWLWYDGSRFDRE